MSSNGKINIYVGNLSPETSENELRQEFTAFGEVYSVTIMNDQYIGSGQSVCYGFVEMASKLDGLTAIAGLMGKKIRNKRLSVVEALPLSDKDGKKQFKIKTSNRINRSRQRARKASPSLP